MKLIVCLDDQNGMLFGGKRQSRDRAVCEKILSITQGAMLWMNHYSYPLFADMNMWVAVDDAFLSLAAEEDWCFVENTDVCPYLDSVSQIIIFKWNRRYPADMVFSAELTGGTWKLNQSEVFSGYSHDRITMEVYTR